MFRKATPLQAPASFSLTGKGPWLFHNQKPSLYAAGHAARRRWLSASASAYRPSVPGTSGERGGVSGIRPLHATPQTTGPLSAVDLSRRGRTSPGAVLTSYNRDGVDFTTRAIQSTSNPWSFATTTTTSAASLSPNMYTTSFAFFEALWEAGVTHCFVNLGSDHPSIIEAMVKGTREKKDQFPRIITCPNEVSRSISPP